MGGTQTISSLSVEEILSLFHYIFVCSGIIMSIVVVLGIIGNSVTMVILCHKSLRSAPVCILQYLTVHALVNMAYSVYSDIEPAIRSYMAVLDLKSLPRDIDVDICDLNTTHDEVLSCMQALIGCKQFVQANTSADNNRTSVCEGDLTLQNQLTSVVSTEHSNQTTYLPRNTSYFEYSFLANGSRDADKNTEVSSFVWRAIEHCFAYTIVYFGLLLTIFLAIERFVAVYFPLKAYRLVTIHRTRLAILGIAVVCCLVHLPQLLLEIARAVNSPQAIKPEHDDLLIASWRRDYERFFTVSSLFLCILLFIINVTILRKITILRKRYASSKHTRNTEHAEVNVSLIIIILIFFQLPLYIFINVVTFISKEKYIQNFSLMTRLMTFIRLLYISQSAANFLVYCVFAHKFRKVLRDACNRLAATSGLAGNHGNRTDDVPLEKKWQIETH